MCAFVFTLLFQWHNYLYARHLSSIINKMVHKWKGNRERSTVNKYTSNKRESKKLSDYTKPISLKLCRWQNWTAKAATGVVQITPWPGSGPGAGEWDYPGTFHVCSCSAWTSSWDALFCCLGSSLSKLSPCLWLPIQNSSHMPQSSAAVNEVTLY